MRFDIDIRFPFVVQQGLLVAESIAAQLRSDNRRGVMLRLTASTDDTTGITTIGARFQGGTYVLVSLFDRSTVDGGDRRDWVVVGARARYWARAISVSKVEEHLGINDLRVMEEAGGWHGPPVVNPTTIRGEVGIFIKPDPGRRQEGHYTQVGSVSYAVFVPGDRDRAIAEAKALAAY